jgi:hypothetical protein
MTRNLCLDTLARILRDCQLSDDDKWTVRVHAGDINVTHGRTNFFNNDCGDLCQAEADRCGLYDINGGHHDVSVDTTMYFGRSRELGELEEETRWFVKWLANIHRAQDALASHYCNVVVENPDPQSLASDEYSFSIAFDLVPN